MSEKPRSCTSARVASETRISTAPYVSRSR